MHRVHQRGWAAAVLLLGFGCCRQLVPPAIDLRTHEIVGVITFKTTSPGNLADFATQKFIEWIRRDQKGIRILELGAETEVLAAIKKTRLDPDAVREIAQRYNIKTLITGDLSISHVRPRIGFAPGIKWLNVSGNVDATLDVNMIETETGASIWSGSGHDDREVGSIGFNDGRFSFNAQDPEAAYGDLVRELVKRATRDFRNSWKCKW